MADMTASDIRVTIQFDLQNAEFAGVSLSDSTRAVLGRLTERLAERGWNGDWFYLVDLNGNKIGTIESEDID